MDFIPCTLKELPHPERYAAARTAIAFNPVNAPNPRHLSGILASGLSEPEAIGLLTSKYWGSAGVKLGVAFLDTTEPSLKSRILGHMNAWNERANVVFREASAMNAEVRIARTPGGGYWSYLGTDILHIPRNQPTMNLDSFAMQTRESEYHRVVRHETGHTLGCPHEHMRREIVARLDRQKTIAYFLQTQGWSPDETVQQVLTPIEESSLLRVGTTPHAEEDSIMCYQLPGAITVDGQPIVGGVDITADDAAFIGAAYPKADAPQPPPPPPGPPKPGVGLLTCVLGRLAAGERFLPALLACLTGGQSMDPATAAAIGNINWAEVAKFLRILATLLEGLG